MLIHLMMCLHFESEDSSSDPLNDVLILVESLMLVDVDTLSDVLVLVESLTLVDVDALNDVLALAESERLVLVDHLMTSWLVESLTLVE